MRIQDIGGEFGLIDRLSRIIPIHQRGVIVGIGDDAAVLQISEKADRYLLVTTDTMVEKEHFNLTWSRPEQIGLKAVESNVSDIAAMGGTPMTMVVSLVVPSEQPVEWVDKLYQGMGEACQRYHIAVVGGDTTCGALTVLSLTLLGEVDAGHLCLRSQARTGDIIGVTGCLGASSAGLRLLQRELPVPAYLLEKHLAPRCRMDIANRLAPIVNAMIDISDGLSSEVHHICTQSRVGALIRAEDVPLHRHVLEAGVQLGIAPLDFALGGGEDYELLFTISPERIEQLNRTRVGYYIIGRVISRSEGVWLLTAAGGKVELEGGYNHFRG